MKELKRRIEKCSYNLKKSLKISLTTSCTHNLELLTTKQLESSFEISSFISHLIFLLSSFFLIAPEKKNKEDLRYYFNIVSDSQIDLSDLMHSCSV